MQTALGSQLENGEASRAWSLRLRAPPKDALVAIAAFLGVVLLHHLFELKDVAHYVYWQDWADQTKYIQSARAFGRGALDPELHWYPLLYPLAIGALIWLPPFFAVLIVNLACYALTYLGFREVATRFGLAPSHAALLFIATTLLGGSLAESWIDPWTTTLSSALIWLALGRVCRDFDPGATAPAASRQALSGLTLGLIPLCRPADVVVSGILGAFVLFRIARSPDRLRGAAVLAAGALAPIAAYGALYLAIYGPHATDYMKLSAAYGLNFSQLGWKSVLLIVEPRPFYPFGVGMLERFPWLALGAAGLIVASIRTDRRFLALLIGLPAFAYAVVMIAYVDLLPSGLWVFRNFHYFKWLMPAMGLFAYDFAWSFRSYKRASIAALGMVLAASSLHYEAVAAAPNEPARLVTFAAPDVDFGRLYFDHSIITDKDGRLRNTYEYHQVPDARGLIYAEALRRDFAGAERWSDAPPDVDWPLIEAKPKTYPALLGAEVRAPLGRYRPKLVFGWPCWLWPSVCRLSLPDVTGAK